MKCSNRMVVDFHSHILPCMDDGSHSVEESLGMLRLLAGQGVDAVVLTPHFYANHDCPERFIKRRARSLEQLMQFDLSCLPKLVSAAEVTYFEGITGMDELSLMRVGNTSNLLIEMPFRQWSTRMVDDILDIQSRPRFSVIIAHIERYASYQSEDVLTYLIANGVKMQANAESFCNLLSRRNTFQLLKNGCIHLLGTDCHNLTSRPPVMEGAMKRIAAKCGESVLDKLLLCGESMISPGHSG